MCNFAREEDVTFGSTLVADDGFDCLSEGTEVRVFRDTEGLYVYCAEGRHYIDGQLQDDNIYIGFYQIN